MQIKLHTLYIPGMYLGTQRMLLVLTSYVLFVLTTHYECTWWLFGKYQYIWVTYQACTQYLLCTDLVHTQYFPCTCLVLTCYILDIYSTILYTVPCWYIHSTYQSWTSTNLLSLYLVLIGLILIRVLYVPVHTWSWSTCILSTSLCAASVKEAKWRSKWDLKPF